MPKVRNSVKNIFMDDLGRQFYSIPAIKYKSGNRTWYILTTKCSILQNLNIEKSRTKKTNEIISSGIRNRFIDKRHKDDIKEYIKKEKNFIMPALTLVSMHELDFKQCDSMSDLDLEKEDGVVGTIKIKMHNKLECLDGNHRLRALLEVFDENPDVLKNSSIVLNIVVESVVQKIKQDFVDINKNAKPTTPSINSLFNTRDPVPNLTRKTINESGYLDLIIENIATSISNTSPKIYTLNNIGNVIIELCGKESQGAKVAEREVNRLLENNEQEKKKISKRCLYFFRALTENEFVSKVISIHRNSVITQKAYTIKKLRDESVILLGVGITIVAAAAYKVFDKYEEIEYDYELKRIMDYDWSRENKCFKNAGLVASDDSIITNRKSIIRAKKEVIKSLNL